MPYTPRRRVTMPRKRYTVVLQCCDPPMPVSYRSTDSRARARLLFETRRQLEIRKGGGGEFELILFEHTPESRVATMVVPAEENDEGVAYVYNLDFPGSTRLAEFTYMDLLEDEAD